MAECWPARSKHAIVCSVLAKQRPTRLASYIMTSPPFPSLPCACTLTVQPVVGTTGLTAAELSAEVAAAAELDVGDPCGLSLSQA